MFGADARISLLYLFPCLLVSLSTCFLVYLFPQSEVSTGNDW